MQTGLLLTLTTTDALGNPVDEQLGPVINVISGFDPLTGLMDYRTAGAGTFDDDRQELAFEWDLNGNLKKRTDDRQNPPVDEEFFYDALNRLDYSRRNGV